jgi:hypothetical protein
MPVCAPDSVLLFSANPRQCKEAFLLINVGSLGPICGLLHSPILFLMPVTLATHR